MRMLACAAAEWLSWGEPDPDLIQYRQMVAACEELCTKLDAGLAVDGEAVRAVCCVVRDVEHLAFILLALFFTLPFQFGELGRAWKTWEICKHCWCRNLPSETIKSL